MSSSWELWSLFGDLTAAGDSPSEEDRFRRLQRYQKAHSCLTQKPGAEKLTDIAKQMLEIAVKVCNAYRRYDFALKPNRISDLIVLKRYDFDLESEIRFRIKANNHLLCYLSLDLTYPC